jgi:hypothetical protein
VSECHGRVYIHLVCVWAFAADLFCHPPSQCAREILPSSDLTPFSLMSHPSISICPCFMNSYGGCYPPPSSYGGGRSVCCRFLWPAPFLNPDAFIYCPCPWFMPLSTIASKCWYGYHSDILGIYSHSKRETLSHTQQLRWLRRTASLWVWRPAASGWWWILCSASIVRTAAL